MKIKSVNLETVCGITSRMPENDKLEVAFAGRSNVGKSTLINGLMNRKSLARTSSQPGKTQTVNFYNINDLLYFVDLPGYGYAKVSQQTVEKWGKMINRYLDGSKVLRLIFLLVDIRHKPIKRSQKAKQIKQIKETLGVVEGTPVIPYSSMTKEGREEIWEYIDMVYDGFMQEQDLQSE